MFEQVTRKLSPVETPCPTIKLDPQWLAAQVAADRQPALTAVGETSTTLETAYSAPTSPNPAIVCTEQPLRDLDDTIRQFAQFGWDRLGKSASAVTFERDEVDLESDRGRLVREYLAIHQRCAEGLSVTDIAAANVQFLERGTRRFIDSLALSYWDLYEVVGVRGDDYTVSSRFDGRLFVVRRLHDDIEVGDIVVARLVDLGDYCAASTVLLPTHIQQRCLYDRLAESFTGRSWAGFMRNDGARIVLDWALGLL